MQHSEGAPSRTSSGTATPSPPAVATDGDDLLGRLVAEVRDLAILTLDAQGHVRSWNAGAAHLKGYAADEIIGRHFSVLYDAEDVALGRPTRHLEAAAARGRFTVEGWRVRRDGSRFWANVVITALRSPDGELRGFGKMTRDLTEPRAAQLALQESERLVSGVLSAATEYSIIGTDLTGTITTFNSGAERMLGHRAADVVGRTTPVLFHDVDEVAERAAELGLQPGFDVFVAAARDGRAETRHWTYVRADATRLAVQLTITAVRDDDGRPQGYIGIASDISARLAAEDALRAAEERFRRAFYDAPVGLAIVSARPETLGRYLDVNAAWVELVGYDRAALLEMSFQSLSHPRDAAGDAAAMDDMLSGRRDHFHGEKRYISAEGAVIEASVSVNLIRDDDGEPLHFISQIEDVSARKLRAERLRLQGRIHDDAMQLALAARQDVEDAVDGDPDALQDARATLRELTGQLRLLSSDLRIEARSPEAVEPALRASVAALVRQAGLEVRLALDPEALAREPDLIFDVARELITNAAKHAHATCVTVVAEATPSSTTLTVSDDGVGIDPERRAQARSSGHIGLTLTTQRVSNRGGTLRVLDVAGTTIVAAVPIDSPSADRPTVLD